MVASQVAGSYQRRRDWAFRTRLVDPRPCVKKLSKARQLLLLLFRAHFISNTVALYSVQDARLASSSARSDSAWSCLRSTEGSGAEKHAACSVVVTLFRDLWNGTVEYPYNRRTVL